MRRRRDADQRQGGELQEYLLGVRVHHCIVHDSFYELSLVGTFAMWCQFGVKQANAFRWQLHLTLDKSALIDVLFHNHRLYKYWWVIGAHLCLTLACSWPFSEGLVHWLQSLPPSWRQRFRIRIALFTEQNIYKAVFTKVLVLKHIKHLHGHKAGD